VATADGAFGGALAPAHEATRRTPVVIAVEKAGPSVVNISTEQIVVRQGDPFYQFRDPFFDQFFSEYFERFARPQQFRTHSLGSGVIIDPEGHVVTNEHVVRKASRIDVTLADGSKYEGKLLSGDPESDLALIELNAKKPLPALRLGRSDDLMIGETVIALGNPFGLESTVTVGVVSAKNRSVTLEGREAYAGLVQTDAAINPGNSGGPLLDSSGRLIGMNTMIFSRSGSSAGIGFAVPATTIERVVPQLIRSGRVEQVGFGIEIDPAQRIERRLGLSGVVVLATSPDGPARKAGMRGLSRTAAGLELGDVIVAIDQKPVKNYDDLYNALDGRRPKERVTVTLVRERKRLDVSIELVTLK